MTTLKLRLLLYGVVSNLVSHRASGQFVDGYEYFKESADHYQELTRHRMEHVKQASEAYHERQVAYHEHYNENFHNAMESQQTGEEQMSEKFEDDHEKHYTDSLGRRRSRIEKKGN